MCYYIYMWRIYNQRRDESYGKKQHDIGRIATKIIAGFLAVLMVVAFAGTLIYYLVVA